MTLDPGLQTLGIFEETSFCRGNHGDFFEPTLGATTEDEHAVGVFGIDDFPSFYLLIFAAIRK